MWQFLPSSGGQVAAEISVGSEPLRPNELAIHPRFLV